MSLLVTSLILATMGQSASVEARVDEQKRLEACIARINKDPSEAYEDGLAWVYEGGRPFARQCTALALIELGHADEGAIQLEELANAENGGSIGQRLIYLTQAGNAWILAGAFEAAIVTLENAIRLSPHDPQLRADRAAALIGLERWAEASDDLDRALQAVPGDLNILKMRAETRLHLEDLDGAERDVLSAMAIDGTDIQTLLLRGRVREAKRLLVEEEAVERLTVSPTILSTE